MYNSGCLNTWQEWPLRTCYKAWPDGNVALVAAINKTSNPERHLEPLWNLNELNLFLGGQKECTQFISKIVQNLSKLMCEVSIDNLSHISLGTNPLVEPKQWQPEYLFRHSTRQNQGHSKLTERLKSHT